MALPANVGYSTVVGQFIKTALDSGDSGVEPDGIPLEGLTITFTPNLAKGTVLRNDTSTPPVVIVPEPIVALTDATGVLYNPITNAKNVTLVASDDPDLDPHGWSYRVTIEGAGVNVREFSIVAPVGATVDLAGAIPVPTTQGEAEAWKEELEAIVVQANTARTNAVNASLVAVGARDAAIGFRNEAQTARDGASSYYGLTQDLYGDTLLVRDETIDAVEAVQGITAAFVITEAEYASRKQAGTLIPGAIYLTKD